VALRVLDDETGRDSGLLEVLQEHAGRIAALSVRCPAIAAVHECGRAEGGGLYLALEHPQGQTLAEVLQREALMPPRRAVRLAIRIAEALESAHMLGIVHGSLTPHNVVLVGADETVKLTQFGIDWLRAARGRGGEGQPAPTEASPYLAPEQILTGEATAQSDVYAVGAILYEALAGQPPVARMPSRRRATALPLRKVQPDVPQSLERVVMRALEPDAGRRYRDMTDLFNDLWSEVSPFPNATRPAEGAGLRRGRVSAGWSRVVAVGVVFAAVILVALVSRLLVSEPPAPVSPARAPAPRPEVAAPASPAPPPASEPAAPAALSPARPPVAATPAPPPASEPAAPAALPPAQPPVAAVPAPPRPPDVRPAVEPPPRPVAQPPRPAARPAPAPSPATPREEPAPPPRSAEAAAAAAARDSEDSGAIIDWLLKESSSARR
jgi:hypothetical protein